MPEAIALVVAYLLGSIPSGYIAGRINGVDMRTQGSGNTGAANVFRTLGRPWGIGVMAADVAKGALAVVLARWLTDDPWPVVAAIAAMAGNVLPVWLRFRGGKGVATGLGVLLALVPLISLLLAGVWLLIVVLTRYTSVASLTCALAAVPAAWLFGYSWHYIAVIAVMAVVVFVRHRSNIARLLHGRELRVELGRARRA